MRILVVDDSNDKIANIITAIRTISDSFVIDTVIDFVSAQRKLVETKYDLLITDLSLPLRDNEEKDDLAGKKLINEISRSWKLNSPDYLIGITQYEELLSDFSGIWPVIHYSPLTESWKDRIWEVVRHIQKAKSLAKPVYSVRPTIFCEGITDKRIVEEGCKIFCPELLERIDIKSEKGGGANWVARQIIVWAYSLHASDGSYIRSAGLLDSDSAGQDACEEIRRRIDNTSAQSQTFKIFRLTPSIAQHIVPFYQKGIQIPISLEEIFGSKFWEEANRRGWLEKRPDLNMIFQRQKDWDSYQQTLKEYLSMLGFTESQQVYLNRFKLEHKDDFCDYLIDLDIEEKREAFNGVRILLEEIRSYLLLS
jgi:CheY-like chemotaxis protein